MNEEELEAYENDPAKREEFAANLIDVMSYVLIAFEKMDMDVAEQFAKKLPARRMSLE